MRNLFMSPLWLLPFLLFITIEKGQAQYHFGAEAGVLLASQVTFDAPYVAPNFDRSVELFSRKPLVGARVGLFLARAFTPRFSLKTGLFGSLQGAVVFQHTRWNLLYLTTPILAVFTPTKPIKIGVGIELKALINNAYRYVENPLALGVRSELTWQVNSTFQLLFHGTIDLTPTDRTVYTDNQGETIAENYYRNITGGLSLAYTIKTFE